MEPGLLAALRKRVFTRRGETAKVAITAIGGGSINSAYRLDVDGKPFFCKVNSATKFPHLFDKEKSGLQRLAAANCIQTPAVIDCFEAGEWQVLLLQWIDEGEPTAEFWRTFGQQVAALHHTSATQFGLAEDNYMGSVPQRNTPHAAWVPFFLTERLEPLVRRCREKSLLQAKHQRLFESLQSRVEEIFNTEPPSLLHGDLWSGNFICSADEKPVLIDPAVYFGHRSMDLGMTALFGGFASLFYEAYRYHYPLPDNYKEQWEVSNLYPLLIHLYLFGDGYLPSVERTLHRFA